MENRHRTVAVVGRFPPPLDGQALATARLADLLESQEASYTVARIDVGAPEGEDLVTAARFGVGRVGHFLRNRSAVREALAAVPTAPVLWPALSPSPLGHARDLVTVAPSFAGRPVVGVVHRGDFTRLFTSPWTRATGRRLARRLARVVFLTEGLSQQCAPWLSERRRVVIPNTIDDAAIPTAQDVSAARERRHQRSGVRLLYLSGMIPSKGYPDVLEALAVLRRQGVAAEATFAGRWPSSEAETHFRRRIEALGLGRFAHVRGGVSDRTEIRQLTLDADVFVLPTTYPVEAQPLTVIEALAAGTPVVVTRHAGLPEMVKEGKEGLFVPPHQPEAIADAVVRATAAETWTTLSELARRRFDTGFSPAVVGRLWTALLESVRGELQGVPRL